MMSRLKNLGGCLKFLRKEDQERSIDIFQRRFSACKYFHSYSMEIINITDEIQNLLDSGMGNIV